MPRPARLAAWPRALTLALAIALTLWVVPHPAGAQSSPLTVVGQIGGVTDAVAVAPPHAFIGVGPRVVVLDVRDPTRPVAIAESPVLPGIVVDVGLYDHHVIAHLRSPRLGPGRLAVIDIAKPELPLWIATVAVAYNHRLTVAGSRAYLAGAGSGLQVVDLTDPRAPRVLTPDPALVGSEIAVAGDVGVLGGADLRVLDLADPSAPTIAGSLPGVAARAVAVAGGRAYLVGRDLTIIDIGDPARPRRLATADFGLPRDAADVAVAGDTVYVGLSRYDIDYAPDGLGRVLVVDAADPARPRNRGLAAVPDDLSGLAVAGDMAYVATGYAGLRVVDVSDPDAPRSVGQHTSLPAASSVVRTGDHVVVAEGQSWAASGSGTLSTWSVREPARPRAVGRIQSGARMSHAPLVASGSLVVAGAGDGFSVVDAADPAAPRTLVTVPLDDYLPGMAVNGGLLYLANKLTLRVWDLSAPGAPREVGALRQNAVAIDVAPDGDRAYVAICGGCFTARPGPDRLQVLDVRDPSRPVLLGSVDYTIDNAFWTSVVALGGRRALVGGKWLVDARDPTRPRLEGVLRPVELDTKMLVHGDRLFTLSGTCLRLFDVSNPAHPVARGSVAVPDYGGKAVLAAAADHVFAAAGSAGLYVARHGDGPPAFDPDCPAAGYQALEWRPGTVYLPALSRAVP